MESMLSGIVYKRYVKDHTAGNIVDELKMLVTDEWNITKKIVAVVTDNAANIVAAIRLNGWKHIPCFLGILRKHLVLMDGGVFYTACIILHCINTSRKVSYIASNLNFKYHHPYNKVVA